MIPAPPIAPVGYGLIGAGGFGRFCLDAYADEPTVVPRAVTDVAAALAHEAAAAAGIDAEPSVESLLERQDVELVHVATPPHTHRPLVEAALNAGKHVLCEKPLATTVEDVDALADLAKARRRSLLVNLIMRHDPLNDVVRQIIHRRLLGDVLHGFFENYAGDEQLHPEHWFWDPLKSGGIFVEHGVHFFDLFDWWLGTGRIVAAQQTHRPHADLIDQIQCTARYPRHHDITVNFYHGFTQPGCMDRQELRLLFERGAITLHEWVPTRIDIDGLADRATLDALVDLLHDPRVEMLADFAGRTLQGRHQPIHAAARYRLTAGVGMDKPQLYQHVVRSLIRDQAHHIRDPSHAPLVDTAAAVQTVHTAAHAQRLADG